MNVGLLNAARLASDGASHPVAWPLLAVCVAADAGICILLLLKAWAYGIEMLWMYGTGGQRLRTSYMRSYHHDDLPRTYEADLACGRPRPLTRKSDTNSAKINAVTIFGYAFKTPSLILISMVLSLAVGTWAPAPLCITTACLMALVVLFMLATSLVNRLVLGPFDQLNPDLAVGKGVEGHLYPGSSPLGRYLLALVGSSIMGFTVIYANIAHAIAGAFTDNQSVDPIRWIYFTSTIASTIGFGDIRAVSDVGRIFVLMQLFAGSLLLTWIAAVFLGDPLPAKDPDWEPAVAEGS